MSESAKDAPRTSRSARRPSPDVRREEILEAAAAVLARTGVAATTVRQICQEADILNGTLYYFFDSKVAVIDAIMKPFHDELISMYASIKSDAQGTAFDRLRALIGASLTIGNHFPQAVRIYLNDAVYFGHDPDFERIRHAAEDVRRTWIEIIESGMIEGTVRDDIPPLVVYSLLRDAVWQTLRWFEPSEEYDGSRLAEDIAEVFFPGLAATGFRYRRRARTAARTEN